MHTYARTYLAPLDKATPCACASCARMMYDKLLFARKLSIALEPKHTAPPPRGDSPNPVSLSSESSISSDAAFAFSK